MNHLDLTVIGGYAVTILIFMSTSRLFLQTNWFGIPIMNFISFSNIITYILDVVYGLTIFILITALIILFRMPINEFLRNHIGTKFISLTLGCISIFLVVFFGILVIILYRFVPITTSTSLIMKFSIFFGVGITGVVFRYLCNVQDYTFLLLIMIFTFGWLFMKVIVKEEMQAWLSITNYQTEITFKPDSLLGNFIETAEKRYVTNTMEFVFIYYPKDHTYTAYPMAQVCSIKANGRGPKMTTL
jgi:hypothetical protein